MKSEGMRIAICAGAYEYFMVVGDLMAELKLPKPEYLEMADALIGLKLKGRSSFDLVFMDYDLVRNVEERALQSVLASATHGVVMMFSPSDVDQSDRLFSLGMKDFIVKNYAHTKLKNRIMEIWETLSE